MKLLTVFCIQNLEIHIDSWPEVDSGKDWWNRDNNIPCSLHGVEFTVPTFITEVPNALKVEDFVISSELLCCVIVYIHNPHIPKPTAHCPSVTCGAGCVLSSSADSLKSRTLKVTVFWVATLCELVEMYQHCVETSCLHLQYRREKVYAVHFSEIW